MGRIARLPAHLANQIAAGEVVERPSSVVKELVENALDASATRVQVSLSHAGFDSIVITDDGVGMDSSDAELALERHATSKIRAFDDLMQIATFGFRGEALPSIASVANLMLLTRERGASEGIEIRVEDGVRTIRPAGCPEGTRIEVRDLFFNVPARRKFLKAQNTEAAHVTETILLAALARPEVSFTLTRDTRLVREYLRANNRTERVRAAFDEPLEYCSGERGPLCIEAFVSRPERARTGATGLHLFINGRPVRDRMLARAVAQAYGSVLSPGKYPVGVVYIEVPPEHVDVNVHPQKAEVRLADGRSIADAIGRELNRHLARVFSLPAFGAISPRWQEGLSTNSPPLDLPTGSHPYRIAPSESTLPVRDDPDLSPSGPENAPLFANPAGFYAKLRYLATAKNLFLLCEGDDALYFLDQHAAAERVTFDRLRRGYRSRTIASQRLLVPEIVPVQASELDILEAHTEHMHHLGLEVRAIGETSVAVHSVPSLLPRLAPAQLVRDLLSELSFASRRPFSEAVDLVLATMACHGSARAGDSLAAEEVRALLLALDEVDFASFCPHGRPIVMRLSFDELERKVGR